MPKKPQVICSPKVQFYQSNDMFAMVRDNFILKITPRLLKFQLDKLTDQGQDKQL